MFLRGSICLWPEQVQEDTGGTPTAIDAVDIDAVCSELAQYPAHRRHLVQPGPFPFFPPDEWFSIPPAEKSPGML